jgi:hypothetical protein
MVRRIIEARTKLEIVRCLKWLIAREGYRVLAKGAAVTVPVTYTCSADAANADMYLRFTQRVGKSVAWGESWANSVPCDGTQQTIQITFRPSSDVPFKKGVGYAEAAFTVCDYSSCAPVVRASKEISVK